ncbi:AraC family transcriptional regulator [uncultured Chitinophaga sp.]|uniref:helix-turn-helix domain-containing protein n=1 Tax=uncultured Chitinophaga sp. TaxID=339340 RepID=UPI0026073FB2|nr:AraC family transcriptional regulator [uncultured Chitinophaga sp.]
MITDHKKYELYGKPLVQKVVMQAPFRYTFPITDHACFLYMLEGGVQFQVEDEQRDIPCKHSLFLNCINSSKELSNAAADDRNEIVIVNFHPDVLKRVYDKEMPLLLQSPANFISNRSLEIINNDFLIQKYVEGLLFYFENPALVNEDMLVLKLKEIILLLSQTPNAASIQLILSQIISPTTYTFRQIIDANIFSRLSIEELARETNLSLSSFKREFAKVYNDTPANYIKHKRLEKAASLLLASGERISGIAFQCGFNDLASFTKSFHDKYNVTPTQYRQNQQAG